MKKLTYLLIALLFSSCVATVDVPLDDAYIVRPTPPPVRWYNGYYFQYYNPGMYYHYSPYYYRPTPPPPRPRPHHNGPRPPRPRR